MEVKLDFSKIGMVFGVLIPLWGGAAFLWNYEKNLVKQTDINLMKIDSKIGQAEIKALIYAKDFSNLSQEDRDEYEKVKAAIINLEDQRNRLLFGSNENN
jgi:hypothetical protein